MGRTAEVEKARCASSRIVRWPCMRLRRRTRHAHVIAQRTLCFTCHLFSQHVFFARVGGKAGTNNKFLGPSCEFSASPLLHIWIGEDSYNFRETNIAGNLRSAVIKPVLVATGKMEKVDGDRDCIAAASFFSFLLPPLLVLALGFLSHTTDVV